MERRTGLIILGVVALLLVSVTLLSGAGIWFGYSYIQRQAGTPLTELVAPAAASTGWNLDSGPYARGFGGPGMMWDRQSGSERPGGWGYGGPGMMGGGWGDMPFGSAQDMPCGSAAGALCGGAYTASGGGEVQSLEEVEAIVHDYVEGLGYSGLEVDEIMEFERNYYAIVAEEDTGIGAMEVLVDRSNGAVGPEPGPNMMWNAKYGMHGRGGGMMGMMGGYATDEMTISPQEAEEITQRWLDANLPGRTAGEADPFYGYYTLHFLQDGEIEGMLSVHGSSGDVWYHGWHGDFVAMIEGHD